VNPRLDRRQFLRGSAGLLAGLGLSGLPRSARSAPRRSGAASGRGIWAELAAALQGPLLLPGDPDFTRIAQPWNLRFAAILPAAIARCSSAADVGACLLWAQTNGVSVVARSGGHSYAGYSTTTGLMIDLSHMNQLSYDSGSGQVHLGGGARNSDVYAGLRRVGRAVTHGRCGAVGVAGLVLGGGIGFNMRREGLLCDQMVETEVVTVARQILRCGAEENADLFWACRGGGGGNFGINTSFTFQTFPVDTLTVYDITWTANLDALLPAALDILPATTDRLGCKLSVINNGAGISLDLLGQLTGSPGELRSILAPLYAIATPSKETVQSLPYWDGQDFLSEEGTPAYSHERSRYIFDPVPSQGSRTILDFLNRWPGTQASATWKIFLTGGAVSAIPADASAFVHRDARMISSIELDWTASDSVGTVERNEAWLAEFHEAMRPVTSDECYQNFIDEAQTDYLHAYFGANLNRLVRIKRMYDPLNVLTFPEGIPLALGPPDMAARSDLAPNRKSPMMMTMH